MRGVKTSKLKLCLAALLLLCLLFLLAESVLLLFEHVSARARGAAQVPS